MLATNVDPDQMPHYVTSDQSWHCLPRTLLRVPGKNGFRRAKSSENLAHFVGLGMFAIMENKYGRQGPVVQN